MLIKEIYAKIYFKGVSREWHKEYPETYESIKHDKKEVIRQNIILEICNSHFDFYEDLIHVKKGIVFIYIARPFCLGCFTGIMDFLHSGHV